MKRDVFRIFITNLIKMLVAFLTAFIVPKILSVNHYGHLKTFQFYASYLGILHLGFCDGIYLTYGGRDIHSIQIKNISRERSTLFFFELFVSILFFIIAIYIKDYMIFMLSGIIIPSLLFTFFIYVYQATGDLKTYSFIMNINVLFNLVVNILLVLMKVTNYKVYILGDCVVQWVSFAVARHSFKKRGFIQYTGFSGEIFFRYIRMGILLMIGNFVYVIFMGIDKWFIKFSLGIGEFSYYSFAAQMVTVVNMFVSPVAMTLYSYLSREKNKIFEIRIKKILVVLLMLIPVVIIILEMVITYFLTEYKPALKLVNILLITQIFLVLNTAVFVNLYKVYQRQKCYFTRLCISLMVAIVLDGLVFIMDADLEAYAIATLVSMVIWWILNMANFKYLVPEKKEMIYFVLLMSFYFLSLKFSVVVKIICYFILYIILTRCLMKEEWIYLTQQIRNILKYK